MARTGVGNFREGQLYQPKSWTALTNEEHIDMAWGRDPQYLTKIIKYLVDVNMGTSFIRWLDQFPTRYVETNQPFKWRLQGYPDKTVTLIGAYIDELGGTAVTSAHKAGQNQAYIYLDFPERRFTNTAIIVGENPDYYKLHIQGDPIQVSSGWRYKCRLVTNNNNEFVPADILAAGSRWSIEGGAVERYGSTRGQDISFQTSFEMEERCSTLRMEHKISGEMIDIDKNAPFVWKMQEDGQEFTYWLNYVEWKLIKEFYQRKAEMVYYGNTTVRDDGTSALMGENGNAIVQGRGLRQQFLSTNQHYYNEISLDFLTETALAATVGKVSPENRTFVIQTGEYGLMELHRMIQRELKSGLIANASWMGDTTGRAFEWSGGVNKNDLKVRMGQFIGAAVINGINFQFMWMPHYDDLVRNKTRHPKGGMAESHRMTVMDFGSKDEPNVHKIRIKNRNPYYGYIPGLRNPYNFGQMGGKMKPGQIASSYDGYELHLMDTEGAVILDPTRAVEFIPSVLKKQTY